MACGRSKAYRPRKLMFLKSSGETLAMSASLMSQPSRVELVDSDLDVGRVPQGDGVEREAESAKLFFLLLSVGFPDLAAVAVADAPGEAMTEFLAVELSEDAAALLFAVHVAEHVQRFDDAAEFGEQRARLKEAGCGRVFEEKISGAARQRPALERLPPGAARRRHPG